MVDDGLGTRFVRWFRLIHFFNAWALSVVVGLVLALGAVAASGGVAAVPRWLWLAVLLDGVAFASYFTLSSPVAAAFERRGRSVPVLGRVARRLEAWDRAGDEG